MPQEGLVDKLERQAPLTEQTCNVTKIKNIQGNEASRQKRDLTEFLFCP